MLYFNQMNSYNHVYPFDEFLVLLWLYLHEVMILDQVGWLTEVYSNWGIKKKKGRRSKPPSPGFNRILLFRAKPKDILGCQVECIPLAWVSSSM
jgi:hypothetical protein